MAIEYPTPMAPGIYFAGLSVVADTEEIADDLAQEYHGKKAEGPGDRWTVTILDMAEAWLALIGAGAHETDK